jgi:hypothetical protein
VRVGIDNAILGVITIPYDCTIVRLIWSENMEFRSEQVAARVRAPGEQPNDRLSLHIFLRDILKPENLSGLSRFRRVPGSKFAWEHCDASKWPEEDEKRQRNAQFGIGSGDPIPRISRIEICDTPPKLVLHSVVYCELARVIFPDDEGRITLDNWWNLQGRSRTETETVNGAFWIEAMNELARILDGQSKALADEVWPLPPVTWFGP